MNSHSSAVRHTAYFCALILLGLFLLADCCPAFQQATAATQPARAPVTETELSHIIGTLTIWTTILAIFVAVVISASAFNIIHQYYQAGKLGENIKSDLTKNMENEIVRLKEQYKLATLEPPDKILDSAKRDYFPMIENLRANMERVHQELSNSIAAINAILNKRE